MIRDIADYLERYAEINTLTGTVVLAQGNQSLFSRGYGCADHNCQSQCAPETQYRIASITKQFVGAATMRLVEKEQLDLHTPVKSYTDLYPHSAAHVTMHQLLSHTSGLPDYHGLPSYCQFKDRRYSSEEFLELFLQLPLLAEPGTQYNYSGVGYALAGVVLEKITKQPLQKLLETEFFAPLGMDSTVLPYHGHISDLQMHSKTYRLACGYNAEIHDFDRKLKVANSRDISTSYAGGGIISTTGDLLKWNQALHNGQLLQPGSYAQMTKPILNNYAYGIGRTHSKILNQEILWHSGGTEGFNTQLMYIPKHDITVCVLLNLEEEGGAVRLSHQITKQALTLLQPSHLKAN